MMNENMESPEEVVIDVKYRTRNTDFDYLAHVLAGALIIAAIIIAGTMCYIFKHSSEQFNSLASVISSLQTSGAVQPSAAAPSAAPAAAAGTPVKITLKPNTPYLGSNNAKVTVVEFADYRCPFCERWYTSVMPELKSKYIDTGKIKFVYQDFAFLGPDSNTAAEAAHCAIDQNKFWQYHDYLFDHQGSESGDWASAAHQKEFAKAVGLNTTQFNQCLDSGKYKQAVIDETAAGKSYGVSGTPTVFVNGQIIVGAQPAATFTAAIEAALKK